MNTVELLNELLDVCAKGGNCNTVTALIQKGANVEIKNRHGFNALHCAVAGMNYPVIKELLKTSIFLDIREDFNGRTALHHAVLVDSIPIIALLIEAGASVHITDYFGFTPLHLAAQNGYMNIVEYLLDAGANINTKSTDGNTPLHLAAESGKLCTVKLLLEHGANKEIFDSEGRSALDLAVLENKTVCARYLEMFA